MMDLDAGLSQASNLLREYGCCARCVIRMLHGAKCQPTDLSSLDSAVFESPVCPVCCGLLHHPRLCTLPTDNNRSTYKAPDEVSDRNLLAEVLHKMDSSDFEYLACQLKVSDPFNHWVREHVIWSRLYDLATGCCLPSFFDLTWKEKHPPERITCHFTVDNLNEWHNRRIPVRRAWLWIVQPILASTLKVPIITLPTEVNSPEFLQANNLDPVLCCPEVVVLRVSVVLFDKYADEECQEFLDEASRCSIPAVKTQVMNMARGGKSQWHADSVSRKGQKKWATKRFELSRERMLSMLSVMWQNAMSPFLSLPEDACLPVAQVIRLERVVSLVLAGRYVKFNRRLPQTPWVVDSKRKLPSSVEELIVDPMREQFGAGTRFSFTTAGREDVDVRCLGLGRPFMVQIEHFEAFVPEVIRSFSVAVSEARDAGASGLSSGTLIDLLRLASVINARSGGQVMVRDLQLVAATAAAKAIKSGEFLKSKYYRAVCWCPNGGLTTELIRHFADRCATLPGENKSIPVGDSLVWPPPHAPVEPGSISRPYGVLRFGPILVNQLTPIRVLHRRTLLFRERMVHSLELAQYSAVMASPNMDLSDFMPWSKIYPPEELFVFHMHCNAGTYVKEFVHGDLGRTRPSLTSLFGLQIDLLALDVEAIDLDWPPRLDDPEPLGKTDVVQS